MRKRLWYSVPVCLLAVAAVAVLAGSAAAGTRHAKISSTLHVTADNTDVDHSDPGLAYGVLSWQIEYETCVPLVGYSDVGGKAVDSAVTPIGATGMPVIKNSGKTYVFTVKSGFHFSDGTPLTAANYKYAIDRDASKTLVSPVSGFMAGVVGWTAATNGANGVSGVTVSGNKLTINLSAPDGSLMPKLAMPFFCPIEKAPPFYVNGAWVDTEVTSPYPAPGPYYIAQRDVGTDIVLKKNPHYSGPRPARASTILIDMNTSSAGAYNGISNGTYAADLNGNPNPAQNYALSKQYGVDKGRFWIHSELETTYLAMNTTRKAFKNVNVRKAVNVALNRPSVIKIGGYDSGSPTVQVLPKPLTGGVYSTKLYPITAPGKARFSSAKKLSKDCGVAHGSHLNFWHGNSAPAIETAAVISYDLRQMGCSVNSVPTAGYARYVEGGVKGTSMDIMTAGWVDDYPDGYDFMHILLDGRTITKNNNNNLAYFSNKTFDQKLDKANALSGAARAKAWGQLDQWVMKNYAPWAPIENTNVVDYLAPNAKGYVFDGPFGSIDLGDFYQS
ncbi:MAG TPA: ABC transporter substrate-binding protein [Gaiellaceae bacterium]|nr:ABC transporter substrate-binding protein [Gaiellaceae bacterium]